MSERPILVDADGVPNEPPPAYSLEPGGSVVEQSLGNGSGGGGGGGGLLPVAGPPPLSVQPTGSSMVSMTSIMAQPTGSTASHAGGGPGALAQQRQNSWTEQRQPPTVNESIEPMDFMSPVPSSPPPLPNRYQPSTPTAPSPPRRSASTATTTTHRPPSPLGPTTLPTPGHPLIHKDQVLIYPRGYRCPKCNNTGFKHDDPFHPCKKCWRSHGQPFTRFLAYSWPTARNGSIDTTSEAYHYQRPMTLAVNPSEQSQAAGTSASTTTMGPARSGSTASSLGSGRPVNNHSIRQPGMLASGGQSNRTSRDQSIGHPAMAASTTTGTGAPPPPPPPRHGSMVSHYPPPPRPVRPSVPPPIMQQARPAPMPPPLPTANTNGRPLFVSFNGSKSGAPKNAIIVRPGDPKLGGK